MNSPGFQFIGSRSLRCANSPGQGGHRPGHQFRVSLARCAAPGTGDLCPRATGMPKEKGTAATARLWARMKRIAIEKAGGI